MPRSVDPAIRAEAERLRGEGMALRGIARQLGVPRNTVRCWFNPEARATAAARNHDYKRRRRAAEGKPVDRICSGCGASFTPTHGRHTYCAACREERARPKRANTQRRGQKPKGPVRSANPERPRRRVDQVSVTLAQQIQERVRRRIESG